MGLFVDDMCTKRLPCGASGWVHKNDEGHPSDSLTNELMDKVETVADKHVLQATILGPGKGSRKVWNRTPDLRRTAAEANDRFCLPKAVCFLINENQLKRAAFNDMVTMKPNDGNMQVVHANKALLTNRLVLQRRNASSLSKKRGPMYNLFQERYCKYVVCLKLQTSRGIAYHSVGWDGTTI